MIRARLEWNDDALPKAEELLWQRLVAVTEFAHAQILKELNISNPPPHKTPSAAGEPPRKRSGFLQGNVQREYDRAALTSRIGVSKNARYGVFLDLGTRFVKARPWLFATIKKYWQQIQALARGK